MRMTSFISPLPAVLVSILSVQVGAALAKGLFPALGPAGTVGLRIGISALLLLAAFRPKLAALNAAQWRAVVPYGLALAVMNMTFYFALERIPLGIAVAVEFAGPLAVAVFGSRKPIDVLWVLLAGAGITLIAPRSGGGSLDAVGLLLAAIAGACWAGYIVLGGRLARVLADGDAVAIGMLVAAVAALPVSCAMGGFARLTADHLAVGAGVALLSSAIPYTLEMVALRSLPARSFGILMSLEPAIAAMAGMVILHELLTPAQWLSVALVIVASLGSVLTSRQTATASDIK